MEGNSSKFLHTKSKLIASSIVTIVMLLTLSMATFTALSTVGHVEAVTSGNCEAWGNANPNGDCDVDVDYDGSCSPSDNNCNVRTSVALTPNPLTGNNKLSLDYILETGIECGSVKSSWGKTNCLLNSQNEYTSDIRGNTPAGGITDNDFNFEGSQQVRETSGQDLFKAFNTMDQDVALNTVGTGSTIKTDSIQLKYLQDIVKPDDTKNTNIGRQYVSLESTGGGIIDTTSYSEVGYSLKQTLNNIDDRDGTLSSPIEATNSGYQILGIDSDNGANIKFDTHGLSTISQLIDTCRYSTSGGLTECINRVGNTPSETTFTGQYTQLTADGAGDVANDGNDQIAGTTINVDNQRQVIDQKIIDFEDANGKDAKNIVEAGAGQGQYFFANAAAGGDINMALDDVTEQTQSISQSITNSDENTLNQVVAVSGRGPNGQAIYIGDDPTTAGVTEAVLGLVEADVDQELTQSIDDITSPPNTGTLSASNTGTMTLTLLAKEGPSKLFIEGFDQYLRQTADNCSNCHNNGQVHATFEVTDAATFTLDSGSTQGLTQTVTQDGKTNTNAVISKISVSGDGTEATIGLDHQISNTNGANSGLSQFTGTYTADANQDCRITQNGVFTQASSGICS